MARAAEKGDLQASLCAATGCLVFAGIAVIVVLLADVRRVDP
jgi:hypothetical protein